MFAILKAVTLSKGSCDGRRRPYIGFTESPYPHGVEAQPTPASRYVR
jgi:hypothetical protein